jgi:hypothetical protein
MTTDEHSPANASGPVVLFSDTEVLLELLRSGGLVNCGVIAKDVRNADAIFGMSLE